MRSLLCFNIATDTMYQFDNDAKLFSDLLSDSIKKIVVLHLTSKPCTNVRNAIFHLTQIYFPQRIAKQCT